ncbi:preprotein translocase subunit SecY, partial [bacterium]|nr:preprotein translocase subunit SecY [bacterium]
TGAAGGLFGFVNMFTGGAFERVSILALGIMPYISASSILQLMTAVIPALEKLAKEGETGRKKITQYSRFATVGVATVQGTGMIFFLENIPGTDFGNIVVHAGWVFRVVGVLTLVTGTTFLMWLGEQITERGIGNGVSLLIFAGIVTDIPRAAVQTWQVVMAGTLDLIALGLILVFLAAIVAAVVVLQLGRRKIPVSYAKQVRGRKVYGGQSTHIPLKVDYSGVIAVIFASAILMLPLQLFQFLGGNDPNSVFTTLAIWMNFNTGAWLGTLCFVVLIVFFCYFYTAVTFNPKDLAENLQKYGGFVPGRRPGEATAQYIEFVLTRITFAGAAFVAIISVLPVYLINAAAVPFYFGGTSLLIVVGVALDTMQQLESHLLMRHYEGFLRKGRLRGRFG